MTADPHSPAGGARPTRARRAAPTAAALLVVAGLWWPSFAAADDQPWFERKKLTGDWNQVRPILTEHGVSPYLTYTGMMFSNVEGGLQTGTEFAGYLDFGLDVDLARALGAWSGSGVHVDWHWFAGRQPTPTLVGGLFSMTLDGWEASNAFRFYNIYFRQTLGGSGKAGLDDARYEMVVGQIGADSDFMLSRYAGLFVNAAFGDLPTENENTGVPVYPLAAPGLVLRAKTAAWTAKLGLYTADAGLDVASNHGFDWGLGNQAGYAMFLELQLLGAPAGLPSSAIFGGYYIAGNQPTFDGGTAYGNYDTYVMLDQALLLDEHGKPRLGAFARFSISPQQDRNRIYYYTDAGLNFFGPIRGRPADALGLAFGTSRLTDDFRRTSPSLLPAGEGIAELTYQILATPWLTLQPDFQAVIDPTFGNRTAYVFGMQAVALF